MDAYAKAETLYNQALESLQAGQPGAAEKKLRKALALLPEHVAILMQLAGVLFQQRRFADSEKLLRQVIRLEPHNPEPRFNLALSLEERGERNAALEQYTRYLEACPDDARAHNNRGSLLADLKRPDEALPSLERACLLAPGDARAQANRARVLQALHRDEEAVSAYERALVLNPTLDKLEFEWSQLNMALGHYRKGWPGFARRWGVERGAVRHGDALWLGHEDVAGKTVLLISGLIGFGDTIQFSRFAPMVAARGARVVLQVQPPLQRLMQSLPGVDQVVTRPEEAGGHDCYSHILYGLPIAFDIELDSVPAPIPYLRAPAEASARWQERLAVFQGLRIGLSWSAHHDEENVRSIPLQALQALFDSGATFFTLQKEVRAADKPVFDTLVARGVLQDVREELHDFADTAALVDGLDLVISCDTVAVHVAGALGRPVWVALNHDADWRWLRGRQDSPWYPDARLFRQPRPGDWAGLAQAMAGELVAQARRS